jgi:cytochrome c peroxidase
MTGEIVKVTDPGRALIDGKLSHIGRFKGPMLRNLAPRAPYFHNGFAKDLDAVVDFYEDRFKLNLNKQERIDLIAFLRAL